MKLLDGKAVAATLLDRIKDTVADAPSAPTLAVILVGADPASEVYVRNKIRTAHKIGFLSLHFHLPADATQQGVENEIEKLNNNDSVDGILLQLPLPKGLDADRAVEKIDPKKDVDGLTAASAGRLALGLDGLRPCTPSGCVVLAKEALGEDLSGNHVVVLGRSILVGKPAAQLFLAENCTVTITHSRTRNLADVVRGADIVVAAIGKPGFVKADWIKPGAVVIDVGINRVDAAEEGKTRLVGDVDFEECAKVASSITPVPGGVGPMTIACLMHNTYLAAKSRRGWSI